MALLSIANVNSRMSAFAGKQTLRTINSNVRLILKADINVANHRQTKRSKATLWAVRVKHFVRCPMTQIFQSRAVIAMPPDRQSGNPRLGRQSPTSSRAPQAGKNQSEKRK